MSHRFSRRKSVSIYRIVEEGKADPQEATNLGRIMSKLSEPTVRSEAKMYQMNY